MIDAQRNLGLQVIHLLVKAPLFLSLLHFQSGIFINEKEKFAAAHELKHGTCTEVWNPASAHPQPSRPQETLKSQTTLLRTFFF